MSGITLIGMPGSGKSTIGRLLAAKIGFAFVDLDNLIRDKEMKTHAQIAKERGDAELSRLEEVYTLRLNLEKTVFAPGGSIVYSPTAMEKLRRDTKIFYLAVSAEEISRRLGDQLHHRGIIGLEERGLAGIFSERLPLYERYAHMRIDCGNKDAAAIVKQVSSLIA